MKTTIVNGIPEHQMERGVDDVFVFNTQDIDWAAQEEIMMDIKASVSYEAKALLRFSSSQGSIQIDGSRIRIPISVAQSSQLPAGTYYYDIKRKEAGKVLRAIPGVIRLKNTTTKLT